MSTAEKKARLDALRPLWQAALRQLQHAYDVELTYTSNAIEGNTLTLRETAEVIDHGITVGGRRLRDYMEAIDHHDAVMWMREVATGTISVDEATVRELHRRVVARTEPAIAGRYSPHRRRVAGSAAVFPNPLKVPELMAAFGRDLAAAEPTAEAAFAAHYRLVAIHPFGDGNGRTARLLMNMLLLRGGFPPVAIRPVDRAAYLDALERASLTGDLTAFEALLAARLEATLDDYLDVLI